MCLYPKLIQNKKYTKTKKNNGVVPIPTDKRVLAVPIGCGKCMECRKKKAREWQVRLLEEIRENKKAYFITLTFSNESIKELIESIRTKESEEQNKKLETWEITQKGYELDNQIATLATRRFLERYRKANKKSVKHYLVTELGHEGTENIHMHGIIWTDGNIDEVLKHWKYGFVWPKKEDRNKTYVNEKTITYITKYINKTDEKHKEYKSIILTSPRHWKKIHENNQRRTKQIQNRPNRRSIQIEKRTQTRITNILQKQNIYRGREGTTLVTKTRQANKMGRWCRNIYKRWKDRILRSIKLCKIKKQKTGLRRQ